MSSRAVYKSNGTHPNIHSRKPSSKLLLLRAIRHVIVRRQGQNAMNNFNCSKQGHVITKYQQPRHFIERTQKQDTTKRTEKTGTTFGSKHRDAPGGFQTFRHKMFRQQDDGRPFDNKVVKNKSYYLNKGRPKGRKCSEGSILE